MLTVAEAKSVDRTGVGPAAPSPRSRALLKPRAARAVELFPSLAGAHASAVRRASVDHGLLRSSANPGEVFGVRRPVAGALGSRLSWLRRSRLARLRRYGSGSILDCSFGGLPSVEPGAARSAMIVVPRNGGGFDEVSAGDSNFSFERTVNDKVPEPRPLHAAAQLGR